MKDQIRIRRILNKWKSDDCSKIDEIEMLSLFHQKNIESKVKRELMRDLTNEMFNMDQEHAELRNSCKKIMQKIINILNLTGGTAYELN